MSDSIIPNASSKTVRVPGSTPALIGPLSIVFEVWFNANSANNQYEVPVQLLDTGTSTTYFELYRAPPNASGGAGDVPNHLYLVYRNPGTVVVDLGPSTSLYGHWIHCAWTQSGAIPNVGRFYAALEGYTPGSPTYLITPTSVGNVTSAGNTIQAGEENSDATTTCLTTSIARVIVAEVTLTEAQISGVGGCWSQYLPTAPITAVDYLFLTCDTPGTPGKDDGNPGTDWTTTGTFAAGHTPGPSEWIVPSTTDPKGLFMGNPTLLF